MVCRTISSLVYTLCSIHSQQGFRSDGPGDIPAGWYVLLACLCECVVQRVCMHSSLCVHTPRANDGYSGGDYTAYVADPNIDYGMIHNNCTDHECQHIRWHTPTPSHRHSALLLYQFCNPTVECHLLGTLVHCRPNCHCSIVRWRLSLRACPLCTHTHTTTTISLPLQIWQAHHARGDWYGTGRIA